MKPVYLAGRALASVLGLTLDQALSNLRNKTVPSATVYRLPGQCAVPYQRITNPGDGDGWDARARALVTRVAADAGATGARHGALIIATSCHDGNTAEHSQGDMDFHALSRRIGDWLDWCGPIFLISSACTSSIQALLSANEWLQASTNTHALVLGLELDNHLTVPGFAALQLLSPDRSRPFALDRNGLLLGEAVTALRLSTQQTAPWLLRGGANVVDGSFPTTASAQSVKQMCQRALASSGLSTTDVDLIKVQAAGSPINDAREAEGLCATFGSMPALLSLKPLIGHCMGASGVAEIALLLECLEQRYWPRYPDATDPLLGVQLAEQAPERQHVVLAAILGFGGSHAAVVLEHSPP